MSAAERSRVENNMYRTSNSIVVLGQTSSTHICASKQVCQTKLNLRKRLCFMVHTLSKAARWTNMKFMQTPPQTTDSTFFYLKCGILGMGRLRYSFLKRNIQPLSSPDTPTHTFAHAHTHTNKENTRLQSR